MLYLLILNGIGSACSPVEEQNRRENEPGKHGRHLVLLQPSFGSFGAVEYHIARPLVSSFSLLTGKEYVTLKYII